MPKPIVVKVLGAKDELIIQLATSVEHDDEQRMFVNGLKDYCEGAPARRRQHADDRDFPGGKLGVAVDANPASGGESATEPNGESPGPQTPAGGVTNADSNGSFGGEAAEVEKPRDDPGAL
jgi:hypothetical protein